MLFPVPHENQAVSYLVPAAALPAGHYSSHRTIAIASICSPFFSPNTHVSTFPPLRKLCDRPVNEDLRNTIRAFCTALVSAINRYYAFGSVFVDEDRG